MKGQDKSLSVSLPRDLCFLYILHMSVLGVRWPSGNPFLTDFAKTYIQYNHPKPSGKMRKGLVRPK